MSALVGIATRTTAGRRAAVRETGKRDARGIALIGGLVLLSALSLLALIASSGMLSQQRMAGNFDDAGAARANAEQAVAGGLALLLATPPDRRIEGCATDCFIAPTGALIRGAGELPALPEFENGAWWQAEGLLSGTDPVTAEAPAVTYAPWAEAPRFTVEEVAFRSAADVAAPPEAPVIDGIGYYRILGRGTGRQTTAVAVNEAIVARPWAASAVEETAADWIEFCAPFRPWYDCGRMAWRARR